MNRLEKLKNSLAEELSLEDDYACDSSTPCKKCFDAASAEYEKIIAELERALEEIGIEQKFYIKTKDYFSEVVRLNLTAREALQNLKDFRGGE